MKLKISATNAKAGGTTVGEYVIDRPDRQAALTDGIAELLAGPNFPPEAVALYRRALVGGFTRDEAQDQILQDFGLQFFAQEVTDIETSPAPNRSFPASGPLPQTQAQASPPFAQTETPRQLLRSKLAGLKTQKIALDRQFWIIKRQRDQVGMQVEECRRLLRAPRKPKLVSVRKRREAAHAE